MKKTIIFLAVVIFAFTTAKAQWEQVGEQNFSFLEIKDHAIAINSEGTPYVLYITMDNPSYKEIRVEKFNGTNWETVGEDNIIETNQFLVTCPYIRIDANDNIYISYHFNDVSNTEKYYTIVRMFNGTNWEKIGEFTSLVSTWSHGSAFCLDNDEKPHVLYYAGDESEPGASIVQKYNGTTWDIISETTLTANSWVYQPGMTIDNNNNIYIAYADHADDSKRVRVDKFNGTSWENIGEAVTEHGAIDQMSSPPQQIIVDNNGFVHLAAITDPYWGGGNMNYVFERYYFNGTEWLGGIIQATNGMSVSLNTDNQGVAYCAYRIIDGTSQGFVQKFNNQEWLTIGEQPVVDDFTLIYIAIDNTETPYILYKDYTNNEKKSSVKKYISVLSDENDITNFDVPNQVGNETIDNTEHTIILDVEAGTDVTDLTPTIEISTNATIDPQNGVSQDFTDPVIYTVTAENGNEQEWQVAIHILTGIENLSANEISIYPNPSTGIFTISYLSAFAKPESVEITNLTGKIIYNSQYSILNSQFSIKEKGIYFITIKTKTGIYTEKIIIQ